MAFQDTGTQTVWTASNGSALTGGFIIDTVRWVGASSVGNTCELVDGNGTIVYSGVADIANYTDTHLIDRYVYGLSTSSLDSGTLYLYLR